MRAGEKAAIVLEGAIDILSDPWRWGSGSFAQNEHGDKVMVSSTEAVSFDTVGALMVVCQKKHFSPHVVDIAVEAIERELRKRKYTEGVYAFNDRHARTNMDVLDVLRHSIRWVRKGSIA